MKCPLKLPKPICKLVKNMDQTMALPIIQANIEIKIKRQLLSVYYLSKAYLL